MNGRSAGGGSKGSQNWDRTSSARFRDLAEYLSPEERKALQELERSGRPQSSAKLALRLLSLGFAELSHGRLALTPAGRSVLASMPAARAVANAGFVSPEAKAERTPAAPPKKSLTDRTIVCLECGRAYKALKRHLALAHGMTPDAYRARWKLPHDYPMVAPLHSRKRRFLAKQMGLGHVARRNTPKRRGKPSTSGSVRRS